MLNYVCSEFIESFALNNCDINPGSSSLIKELRDRR
ncbi:hypothetical protein BRAO375_130005 [Bradyrhizobium sp. ORS 375]|nr:hypothetical protein BRAO375_130005 [Bradyrhizobium sp. ORS 375]